MHKHFVRIYFLALDLLMLILLLAAPVVVQEKVKKQPPVPLAVKPELKGS